jgi:restriction endonuclease S subunit
VEKLKKIQIPLPPLHEQNKVAVRYLAQLEEIRVLRIKLDKAIKRLGEVF